VSPEALIGQCAREGAGALSCIRKLRHAYPELSLTEAKRLVSGHPGYRKGFDALEDELATLEEQGRREGS
jgi:hypothetical protein